MDVLGRLGLVDRRAKPRWHEEITTQEERMEAVRRLTDHRRRLRAVDARAETLGRRDLDR